MDDAVLRVASSGLPQPVSEQINIPIEVDVASSSSLYGRRRDARWLERGGVGEAGAQVEHIKEMHRP